jgi:hypothetical protein
LLTDKTFSASTRAFRSREPSSGDHQTSVGSLSFQWFLTAAGLRLPHTLSSLDALGPDASIPDTVAAIQRLAPEELDELRRFVLETDEPVMERCAVAN